MRHISEGDESYSALGRQTQMRTDSEHSSAVAGVVAGLRSEIAYLESTGRDHALTIAEIERRIATWLR